MAKIAGLGEMWEGLIEIEPSTAHYQIRFVDSLGDPRTLDLHEVLAAYVGREVRFTIALAEALDAAVNQARAKDVEVVTFGDLEKEGN